MKFTSHQTPCEVSQMLLFGEELKVDLVGNVSKKGIVQCVTDYSYYCMGLYILRYDKDVYFTGPNQGGSICMNYYL